MSRRDARISAFCLLFESDFHPECSCEEMYARAEEVGELKVNSFSKALFEAVITNKNDNFIYSNKLGFMKPFPTSCVNHKPIMPKLLGLWAFY